MNNKTKNSNSVQTFWLALSTFSSIAFSILSVAILSRFLSKSDYGTYRQIVYIYTILVVIFSAGLPSVFSFFLPKFTLEEGKDIVSKISKILFIGGMFGSIFLLISSGVISQVLKNPELSLGLKIFAPIPMMLMPSLGIEGIFATYKKTHYFAIFTVLTRLITLCFILIPVIVFEGSYIHALYGWNIASLLILVLSIYFKGVPFRGVIATRSNLKLNEIFRYSLPLLTASLWGVAIKAADQFYISHYFGSEVFAEFANGFIEIPLIIMITGSAATMLLPIFSKMIHEKADKSELILMWNSVLNKSVMLIYPMVIFFLFFAEEIVTVLYSDQYIISAVYFRINIFLNFFNIILFSPLLFAMGKTRFYSNLHMCLALSSWGLGYLAIIAFNSPFSIAILSVSLNILKFIVAFIFISRVLQVKLTILIPYKNIAIYVFHSLFVILIVRTFMHTIVPELNALINLCFSGLFFLAFLLASSVPLKIDYTSVLKPIIANFRSKM
ncbi:MAG: oligosaccharide flippase family protein [Flavobacteriales bacterium]|nr:oligosaccharide flippase family protein [Flavobacteriales bacterium]